MRKLLRRLIGKGDPSENEHMELKFDGSIRFTLKIKDLVIGYLSAEDGIWVFQYSEEFKDQNKYARLTGFSDLDKVYQRGELWPFFKIRIPGLKQPMVKDILRAENLDPSNEAVLLRRFGRLSMSNPYVLEPA